MSRTYAQIQQQIAQLKREAEQLKTDEVAGVIARIKEAIATYQLTPSDLGFGARRRGRPPGSGKKVSAGGRSAAKYRDASGNVWGGRGPRPLWLRDAIKSGKSLDDFAV